MKNIRLARVGNIGDLQRVLLIDVNDVESLTLPDVNVLPIDTDSGMMLLPITSLVLNPDKMPIDIHIKPGSGNFREIELDNGTYEVSIKIDAFGDWAGMGGFRAWVRGRRFLSIVEDTNGTVRLAGTLKQPLGVSVNYDSNRRMNSFTIGAVLPQPAYYMPGIDEDAWRGSTSGFSSGFNFGFRA